MVHFPQNLINNHSNSNFKDHNSLGLIRFGELILDNLLSVFDPCFDALDKNKPSQINISTNTRGKGILIFRTSLITTLIQLSETRI